MITDSCNCCGRTGKNSKGPSRTSQQTWFSFCDQHRARRRCQSEGLYQDGDPLKELNWCCDRGCVLYNGSQKCSQITKTDLEMNAKKINCTDDTNMDESNVLYGHNKNHHSKFLGDSLDIELGNQLHNYKEFEAEKYSRPEKYSEISTEKCKPYSNHYGNCNTIKYQMGDFQPVSSEKELSSSKMRDRYITEMEILRSKLSLLKNEMSSDGKRMRQRSESEPGFAEMSGGVPKRARDISPKMKLGCRKLPAHPNTNMPLHRFPVKANMPFQRESKSLSPSAMKILGKADVRGSFSETYNRAREIVKNLSLNESDEDQEDINGDEVQHQRGDIDTNSDDDESVQSTLTTASSDSNTPSRVGETLSSITLNENPNSNIQPMPANAEDYHEVQTVINGELFRNSLFPNVPPYVKFFMHDFKGPALPAEITKHLKWKLSSITPIVIRRTLINSGFKLVRSESSRGVHESNEWTGQWGKHLKSYVFKTLKDFQKLNHFPGTFQIGRKDRLWKNLYRLMVKFGKKEFGFIPKTYILPHDRKMLRTAVEKLSGPKKGQWIVKPPAAARGTGIKVVHKWGQIPKKRPVIVQKYIAQPYLINESKFDLRLYVLMTSIHPLRIYLYDDGLVRFASVKYSDNVQCLSNRFMHLTNYSINKLSTQYQVNADATSCNGHKWYLEVARPCACTNEPVEDRKLEQHYTAFVAIENSDLAMSLKINQPLSTTLSLKSLWTYLAKEGVNVKALKRNLIDLVIKTIISGESNINILSKNNLPSRYCSYELFGIDVLLDHTLKPWLLEVNISPSLHSASPLDLAVKGPLVKELLNVAGFQIPAKLTKEQEDVYLEKFGIKDSTHTFCYDKRLYWMTLSSEEKAKHEAFQNMTRKEYLNTILDDLTPDDVRHLIQFEDELTQIKRFEKIFPTTHTHTYHQFFESPRYYNMMLDAWETKYEKNRSDGIKLLASLCEQKLHLNVPFPGGKTKSSPSQSDPNSQPLPETDIKSEVEKEEDDIEESKPEAEQPSKSPPPGTRSPVKQKSPSKPSVVSKPTVLSPHPVTRRPKQSSPRSPEPHVPFQETCIKMLQEIRQNGLNFPVESKPEKLVQLPNCKLENTISESLTGIAGKNVLSPGKHIHNACIKMNTSS